MGRLCALGSDSKGAEPPSSDGPKEGSYRTRRCLGPAPRALVDGRALGDAHFRLLRGQYHCSTVLDDTRNEAVKIAPRETGAYEEVTCVETTITHSTSAVTPASTRPITSRRSGQRESESRASAEAA